MLTERGESAKARPFAHGRDAHTRMARANASGVGWLPSPWPSRHDHIFTTRISHSHNKSARSPHKATHTKSLCKLNVQIQSPPMKTPRNSLMNPPRLFKLEP